MSSMDKEQAVFEQVNFKQFQDEEFQSIKGLQ